MADGDAMSSLQHDLTIKLRRSYFFDLQVMLCRSEQFKLVSSLLAQKEKEAQITFNKSFSDQIGNKPQIDNVFVNLILDSDVPVNLDSLIDDLRLLANQGGDDLIRLLDLLFVSRKLPLLLEELDIRKVSYDLYDPEAHGRLGPLATYSKRSNGTPSNVRSNDMALVFSMLATGQDEVVAAALVHMANVLSYPWDALILSRYVFGQDADVTKSIRKIWTESVRKDDQFRVIKTALALKNGSPKDLARELIACVTNKDTDPTEMFNAYRCLAIALHNSASLPEVERNLEMADACKTMRAIYVTLLGWGKLNWARQLVDDFSNRASPGGIPSYICKIALNCHIELVEHLTNVHSNGGVASTNGMSLKSLGQKWRAEIKRENGEMSKLKTDTPGFQTVVYEWLTQLATLMRAPLIEEPNLSTKMECVYIAFEFLHTLLGWAAAGGEEPLRLHWPERDFTVSIKDEAIVLPELPTGLRNRTLSAGSSRSAATAKDDGRKQKKKVGTKEEPSSVPPLDSSMRTPRTMGSQQHRDRNVEQHLQKMSISGPSGDHGNRDKTAIICHNCHQEGHVQSKCPNPPVTLPLSQDIRHGQHGQHTPVASLLTNSLPRGSPAARAPARHDAVSYIPGCPPPFFDSLIPHSSPSPSGIDLDKIDQPSSPSISETAMSDSSKNSHPAALHQNVVSSTTMHQPSNVDGDLSNGVPNPQEAYIPILPTPKSLRVPNPDLTPEEFHAEFVNNLKKNSLASKDDKQTRSEQARSLESTHTGEETCEGEIQKVEQPGQEPDKQFQELTKQIESKEGHDNISPDPSEMHKLFTGNSKGHATLPPGMLAEQGTTNMPCLMVAPEASFNQTQPTSSHGFVVPQVSETANQAYPSSSNDAMLTPITEASQETFGTKSTAFSESDTHGLHNESMDSVFVEEATTNQTIPIHVDVSQQQHLPILDSPAQSTPRAEDLRFPDSCNPSPSEVESRVGDNRSVFPQLSSMHAEVSATAHHSLQQNIVAGSSTSTVDVNQSEQTPAAVVTQQHSTQPLNVTCTESEVKDLVTSCGIPYKFSPTKEQEISFASSNENMSENLQPIPNESNALDSYLSMLGTADNVTGAANQNGHNTNLNSEWTTQSDGSNSTMSVHIGAHSTALLRETVEEGDYAREIGGASMHVDARSIPSVPPTAFTTPQPNFHQQPQVSGEGNEWIIDDSSKQQTRPDCPDSQKAPHQFQSGDFNVQHHSISSNMGRISEQHQQQHQPMQMLKPPQPINVAVENNEWIIDDSSKQQTDCSSQLPNSQKFESGDFNTHLVHPISSNVGSISDQQQQHQANQMFQPPQSSIPTYIDPFDQQQQLNAQKNSPQVQQQSFGGNAQEAPPCFGTGNTAQNAQQHSGFTPSNQNHGFTPSNQSHGFTPSNQSHGFTPSNQSHGFNQGNQNNFHHSNRGSQEFRRDRGGGRSFGSNARGAPRGGSGFGGYGGTQDVRAGHQQQNTGFGQNAGGIGNTANVIEGGDNGGQQSGYPPRRGNEPVRGGTVGRGARGFH